MTYIHFMIDLVLWVFNYIHFNCINHSDRRQSDWEKCCLTFTKLGISESFLSMPAEGKKNLQIKWILWQWPISRKVLTVLRNTPEGFLELPWPGRGVACVPWAGGNSGSIGSWGGGAVGEGVGRRCATAWPCLSNAFGDVWIGWCSSEGPRHSAQLYANYPLWAPLLWSLFITNRVLWIYAWCCYTEPSVREEFSKWTCKTYHRKST